MDPWRKKWGVDVSVAGRKIVIATRNAGKVKEIRDILADLDVTVLSLSDFPGVESPEETGSTFEENAVIKAKSAASATGMPSLADDSGLEVDALGGLPGVRSARFAGNGAGDEANNRKLLQLLKGVPAERRTARFRCAIAVCSAGGRIETTTGACDGLITFEPRGSCGFGYDPLFLVPELGRTFAEIGVDEKNRLSHRGRALRAARPIIARMLGFMPAGESGCCSGY